MDESADKSTGERKSQDPEAARTPADESSAAADGASAPATAASAANDTNLPVLWSPRLDAGEAINDFLHADAAAASSDASAANDIGAGAHDASRSRSLRFALLAASLGCAAVLGSFVGVLSASGVAHLWPPGAATANALAVNSPQAAGPDGAVHNANGQFARFSERLDRIERAQAESAAKIAHMAEVIDRLEKKGIVASAAPTAPETTGSIAASPAPASETKPPGKIVQDWIIQDARGGRALVQSRYGSVFEVVIGAVLPGLGRVEAIKRQDGQWVVVTARGIITER
jgi:hypothetical protein